MTEGSKSLEQRKQILIRKRTVPSGNKAVRQQKLQSSRWNKKAAQSPLSTAPQWRSVEPSKVNPSRRLLPSGRGNNIHFYKKPIHFTMSSSTKTTQPRDPAKSSHFRRKMAQHKRPTKASRCGQHHQWILLMQAQASPAKTMSLTKWSSKISSAAGLNQNLEYENSVTRRPSKDHEPYKRIRGRPSQDYKPGNLQHENSVNGRSSKDNESYRVLQISAGRVKTMQHPAKKKKTFSRCRTHLHLSLSEPNLFFPCAFRLLGTLHIDSKQFPFSLYADTKFQVKQQSQKRKRNNTIHIAVSRV